MRQSWLRLALTGLLLGACSDDPASDAAPDGATLFREQNCITCHGSDGSGTNLGPMLRGKQGYWTREKMAAYLSNPPATIAGDERLKTQAAKYSLPMVAYPYLTQEQRLALADHVLALP